MVAGIMVPHPPLIVPDVGRGQEILIKDTIKAYQEAAYFINQQYRDYKLVRIGGSGLSFADHYRAGRYIARAAENLGRSVFIVASGDLSHKLRGDGPYGYSVQGPEYDERIMDVMGKAEFGELLAFPEDFCEKAGECGHRSFTMMAGVWDLHVPGDRG